MIGYEDDNKDGQDEQKMPILKYEDDIWEKRMKIRENHKEIGEIY